MNCRIIESDGLTYCSFAPEAVLLLFENLARVISRISSQCGGNLDERFTDFTVLSTLAMDPLGTRPMILIPPITKQRNYRISEISLHVRSSKPPKMIPHVSILQDFPAISFPQSLRLQRYHWTLLSKL